MTDIASYRLGPRLDNLLDATSATLTDRCITADELAALRCTHTPESAHRAVARQVVACVVGSKAERMWRPRVCARLQLRMGPATLCRRVPRRRRASWDWCQGRLLRDGNSTCGDRP